MHQNGFIYDWISPAGPSSVPVVFADETLGDRLQPPSVRTPLTEVTLLVLHLMESLEIESADIGFPGAESLVVSGAREWVSDIAWQSTRPGLCTSGLRLNREYVNMPAKQSINDLDGEIMRSGSYECLS
jgi:hypothetical protein